MSIVQWWIELRTMQQQMRKILNRDGGRKQLYITETRPQRILVTVETANYLRSIYDSWHTGHLFRSVLWFSQLALGVDHNTVPQDPPTGCAVAVFLWDDWKHHTWSVGRQFMKERKTDYFSSNSFFSSAVNTSCRGTSVWWTMLTSRSASENSSSRYSAAIATITWNAWETWACRCFDHGAPFWQKGSYFPGRQWCPAEFFARPRQEASWTGVNWA